MKLTLSKAKSKKYKNVSNVLGFLAEKKEMKPNDSYETPSKKKVEGDLSGAASPKLITIESKFSTKVAKIVDGKEKSEIDEERDDGEKDEYKGNKERGDGEKEEIDGDEDMYHREQEEIDGAKAKNGKRKGKKKKAESEDDDDLYERFEYEVEEEVAKFVDEPYTSRRTIPNSSDEDEGPVVLRDRRIRRKQVDKLVVGNAFFTGVEFKEAVLDYALCSRRNITQDRWEKSKLGFKCGIGGKCQWRVYCSLISRNKCGW